MSIKAVLFDLGKVLLRFDFDPAFKRLARHCGRTPKDIEAFFIQSGLEVLYDGGKISSKHFYREVKRALGLKIGFEAFGAVWNRIFTPITPMTGLLARLKRRGYRLVLISNTNEMHFRYVVKKYPFLKHFDRFILSYKVKMRKPDPHIYNLAARACKARPEEIFYIDDREDLTSAAEELGFHVHTYRKDTPKLIQKLKKAGVL